ncbi:uncharacterized protein LOC128969088 [Indicator indicator]|uniref:uncharacterized protein LOC128969088 n=1 Tax=Indicator indicator TaxID=1002788 RepID=UPI0023E00168|nr:uncharacterized protein LOC128969088 [Indicator indicator]
MAAAPARFPPSRPCLPFQPHPPDRGQPGSSPLASLPDAHRQPPVTYRRPQTLPPPAAVPCQPSASARCRAALPHASSTAAPRPPSPVGARPAGSTAPRPPPGRGLPLTRPHSLARPRVGCWPVQEPSRAHHFAVPVLHLLCTPAPESARPLPSHSVPDKSSDRLSPSGRASRTQTASGIWKLCDTKRGRPVV